MFHKLLGDASDDLEHVTPPSRESLCSFRDTEGETLFSFRDAE